MRTARAARPDRRAGRRGRAAEKRSRERTAGPARRAAAARCRAGSKRRRHGCRDARASSIPLPANREIPNSGSSECDITAALAAVECVAYILAPNTNSRNPSHGPNRCDRTGRRHRRHVGGAASRQARACGHAGRSPRARRGDLIRQRRRHRGQYALPAAFPSGFGALLRVAFKRAPEANYQVSFLPQFCPVLAYRLDLDRDGSIELARRCGRCSPARSAEHETLMSEAGARVTCARTAGSSSIAARRPLRRAAAGTRAGE